MKVKVKYFAVLKSISGKIEEDFELRDGSKISELMEVLEGKYPDLKGRRDKILVAVNGRRAGESDKLREGDEVALLPPVAGGNNLKAFNVISEPIPIESLVKEVMSPSCGAVVTFIGMVRDHSEGKEVVGLEYEAYEEMVLNEFNSIGGEVSEKWPDVRLLIWHRVGKLEIGDISVLIAAAAPHRAEAFEACRYAIEELKKRAPIWKRELFREDESRWVGWE